MASYADDPRFPGPDPYAPLGDLPSFELRSETFDEGEKLADEQAAPTSVSPQLSWSGAPEETKSFAVTVFDPDAPTASGYWHWAAFNIPADVTELPAGAGKEGDLGLGEKVRTLAGDSGEANYYGAEPPAGHGPHRYLVAVHAVDTETLDIPEGSTSTVLGFNLYFHSLARAITWGWYENEEE
ncbi:YbhB/YbcL family Raf kinase inhibitor-like protein [Corynebacterium otitidis]|uniref:YbhB/YbcL family Raf kinase inhibitor-like protein n=1 Tax=Corynebacterium otitidis ATCC 51513 TaxID=883169 RepID=I7IX62_9CORY|nr:YbhB/YbcL family Raf kinase inhibitor-like protein [Corynebacterium otitidis]EJZ82447.1 YbhB/YbcL family Raf kinase inhibitor-like protein [Corynebacterium otitidis ATCC 51513]KKO84576.1 phospholipid-binding protein [Corynebacterium otitidis]CCI83558.1 hypothetical protein BN46_0827 [Corynebacterium otitidis ATCC 51513]